MDVRRLTDTVAVAPQITLAEVADVARLGFRMLINNRPDGEDPGQPSAREFEAAAHVAGIAYHHLPVAGLAIGAHDVHAFLALQALADGPVLAFCRSGVRSAMLWALARTGTDSTDQIITAATHAGYDLRGMRAMLERGI